MKLIRSRVSIAISAAVLGLAFATYAAHAAGSGDIASAKTDHQRLNPVAFELCVPEGAALPKCQSVGVPRLYEVPAGHTLVLEQVSGDCGGDGDLGVPFRAGILAETNGVALAHWIVGTTAPDKPGGHNIPLTNTTIYADAGSLVSIDVRELPAFSGRFCQATFSGQLVK